MADRNKKKTDVERLQEAIQAAGINLPFDPQTATGADRLWKFADEISWACTWRETFQEAQSSGHVEEKAVWLAKVKSLANELAGKLEKPPGNMAVMPWDENQPLKVAVEEATILQRIANDLRRLSKIIERLESYEEKLNRPPIKKEKGWSPTDRYISAMADTYVKYLKKRAYVGRINAEGEKGGPFVFFVQKVAKEFGGKVPSVEAIASALRKRKAKRR